MSWRTGSYRQSLGGRMSVSRLSWLPVRPLILRYRNGRTTRVCGVGIRVLARTWYVWKPPSTRRRQAGEATRRASLKDHISMILVSLGVLSLVAPTFQHLPALNPWNVMPVRILVSLAIAVPLHRWLTRPRGVA